MTDPVDIDITEPEEADAGVLDDDELEAAGADAEDGEPVEEGDGT